jgi:hypothetical protein
LCRTHRSFPCSPSRFITLAPRCFENLVFPFVFLPLTFYLGFVLLRCVIQQAFESTKRGWADDLKAVNILLGKTVAARKADYAAKVKLHACRTSFLSMHPPAGQ